MSKPTSYITKVTPELATKWLERNKRNRKVSPRRVAFYLDQMRRNIWQFDGDSLRFGSNGDLMNGQHRLQALIQYGKPLEFVIVEGLDEDAFQVMDTGKSRSAGDAVSLLGIPNAMATAATAKTILLLKRGRYSDAKERNKGISNTEIVKFIKQHPDLEGIITDSHNIYRQFRAITHSLLAALYFILRSKNPDRVDAFFEKYASGSNLSERSPIRELRNRLIKDNDNQSQFTKRDKMALMIHAWNAYVKNKELGSPKVRGVYEFPQPN